MQNVHEIAYSSDRLDSIIFDPGDYSAAMGAPGLDIGQFPEYPGHSGLIKAACDPGAKIQNIGTSPLERDG